jgi:hypothetical protein
VDLEENEVVAQLPASCISASDPCAETGTTPACDLRVASLDRCSVSRIVAGIRRVAPVESVLDAKSRIAITSDGQRAFLVGPRSGQLAVYNVSTGELLDGGALDIPVLAALAKD